MQKREAWRRQEQLLLERWTAASERYRVAHAELAARKREQGAFAPNEALTLKAEAARAEIATLRRQIARLKREFISGARY